MNPSSPIRILRLIARMNVGGPALQISALQRLLDPNEFDSRLFTGYVEEGEADYLELRAPDVAVTRLPELGRSVSFAGDARSLIRLITEVRRFRPHVVHTHTAKAGVLGRVAARIAGVPYVVHTFHGHLLHGYFGPVATATVRSVEQLLARRTDRIVTVGRQVRDDLIAAGIGTPGRYEVVAPGVSLPTPPTREEARSRLNLPRNAEVLAFAARLTQIKRPDRAVDVVARVLRDRSDAYLLVAGEGPELHAMRAMAQHLGDQVRFLGWRPDVEVIYAASDLALLTSDNEGMPVSLIEAQLCGLPAVATDVGSVAEVVADGRTGRVVGRDPDQLARAAMALLRDHDQRRQFGRAARERAGRLFSAERLADDMSSIYRRLVSQHRG